MHAGDLVPQAHLNEGGAAHAAHELWLPLMGGEDGNVHPLKRCKASGCWLRAERDLSAAGVL